MARAAFRLRDAHIAITGAAHGIGRVTALRLAREGARLELCDVDGEALTSLRTEIEQLGTARVETLTFDVADPAAVEAAAREIHARRGALDALVNNAGVGVVGGFFETTLADWHWLFGVNVWGLVHCLRAFVPEMQRRGQGGRIVNVASAAAFMNPVALSAYGSSKYTVVGLSEALREELHPYDIGVSVVCPALVATDMIARMRLRAGDESPKRVEELRRQAKLRGVAPERVADAIVHAMLQDLAVVPVARDAWALYWCKRLVPGLLPKVLRYWLSRAR